MKKIVLACILIAMTMLVAGSVLADMRRTGSSYQQSCIDTTVDDTLLCAKCRTRHGGWIRTCIKYRDCNLDIANIDGFLTCQ